ncbi:MULTISPECIES: hypothetical protein [Acinetobacter]|uniref:hypothetical protein n=1 Tax=Acinetobacter TaxID=469 RepID=UPI0005B50EAB|nr:MULTISPECIES: hypothetical protein [Acinetobacter]MCR4529881.1 hypothetical protein [Acinetobacter venetianus]MDU2409711.1 hypothetical protein [Acinetobacter junii]
MKITAALTIEQNVEFAVVLVKPTAMYNTFASNQTRQGLQAYFPDVPIVLASQDSRGRFSYQGRNDLVDFLAAIDPARLPWKEYTYA